MKIYSLLKFLLMHVCVQKHRQRLSQHFFFVKLLPSFNKVVTDKDLYSWNYNKCEKCLCSFNYFDVFRRHWHPNYKRIQDTEIEKRHEIKHRNEEKTFIALARETLMPFCF